MPNNTGSYKYRIPVILEDKDIRLLSKLRSKLEERERKPLTNSETIRLAIRELANKD